MTTEHMWRAYSGRVTRDGGLAQDIDGRRIFLKLVGMFTRGEQKRRSSVDYMLGALIYDNVDNVTRLVENEVIEDGTKRKLKRQLDAIVEYMKLYYCGHIGMDDDVCHNMAYSLHGTKVGDDAITKSTCKSCLVPFQVLTDIADNVTDMTPEMATALASAMN